MKEFSITKKDGLCDLQGLQMLLSHLTGMPDGDYRIVVQRQRERRSGRQNAWLWAVIYPTLRAALNAKGWEFTDDNQVHEFFTDQICRQKVINRHTGETVSFPDSTSGMDTVEFSTYCQKLIDIATEYLGVDVAALLPDPNKIRRREQDAASP